MSAVFRRRLPRTERRQQLIETTASLFEKHGYERVSLEDIAREAGVTRVIVYRHFPTKQSLDSAVMESIVSDLIRGVEAGFASSTDPVQQVTAFFRACFKFIERRPVAYHMLTWESGAICDRATRRNILASWDATIGQLTKTIEVLLRKSGRDPTGAAVYTRVLTGTVVGVGNWWVRTRWMPVESLLRYTLALVWQGFEGVPKLKPTGPRTDEATRRQARPRPDD